MRDGAPLVVEFAHPPARPAQQGRRHPPGRSAVGGRDNDWYGRYAARHPEQFDRLDARGDSAAVAGASPRGRRPARSSPAGTDPADAGSREPQPGPARPARTTTRRRTCSARTSLDPYGGAFKVTKGLSTRFPDRVLSTPISEGGDRRRRGRPGAGRRHGGRRDHVRRLRRARLRPARATSPASRCPCTAGGCRCALVVRCPTGGGRGYGPTHSQSLQKHFVGVPGLSLYEMSPFHDNRAVFAAMLAGASRACSSRTRSSTPGRWTVVDRRCSGATVDGRPGRGRAPRLGRLPRLRDHRSRRDGRTGPWPRCARCCWSRRSPAACWCPSRLYPLDVETLLPCRSGTSSWSPRRARPAAPGAARSRTSPRAASGTACAARSAWSTPRTEVDPHRRAPRTSGAGGGRHHPPRRTGGPRG